MIPLVEPMRRASSVGVALAAPNKALHRTGHSLRSWPAGEHGRLSPLLLAGFY